MVTIITEFLVNMMLWHLTWGWKHIIISICMMPFLMKWIAQLSFFKALMVTFVAHIGVSGLYMSLMSLYIHYGNQTNSLSSAMYLQIYSAPLICAFVFALFYALLQILFLTSIHYWYPLPIKRIIVVVLLCNCISAYLTSLAL